MSNHLHKPLCEDEALKTEVQVAPDLQGLSFITELNRGMALDSA